MAVGGVGGWGEVVEDSSIPERERGMEGEVERRLRLALMQNRNVVNFISLNFALALHAHTHTRTLVHVECSALICQEGVGGRRRDSSYPGTATQV